MDIIFNKNTPYEEVYKEEDILKMTKQELKNLKTKCQTAMSDISLKRTRYKSENTEDQNSHEFWKRMNTYKTVIGIYQKNINYLCKIENQKEPSREQKDNEHWLWCYYQESLKMLTEGMVEQISEMADERAGFHIEFERFN